MNIGKCPVCGGCAPGNFLPCEKCRARMEYSPDSQCSLCGIDLAGGRGMCIACRGKETESRVSTVVALGDWRGPLREWVSLYKNGADIRLADYLVSRLSLVLNQNFPGVPIVPVPPRRRRIRKDGFDPVGHLARRLAAEGRRILPVLKRVGNKTQKGRSRRERTAPGALSYRLKRNARIKTDRCLILDDVMTTGATLEACASALSEAGVGRIDGLVICRD